MAIRCRAASMPVYTGIDTTQIMRISQLVSAYTGMRVQANKAIVGANAFAHESGIHQDGMLKHQETYEIIRPETVGVVSLLVMGKHSGRAAFKQRLVELGYEDLSDDDINKAFKRFKAVADSGKAIVDQDLHAIVRDELHQPTTGLVLAGVHVSSGTAAPATATVTITTPDGATRTEAAVGVGPINAVFQAIARAAQVDVELVDFTVKSITGGTDALGEVMVCVRGLDRPEVFAGHGADPDILVASAHAYLGAVCKYLLAMHQPTVETRRVSGV